MIIPAVSDEVANANPWGPETGALRLRPTTSRVMAAEGPGEVVAGGIRLDSGKTIPVDPQTMRRLNPGDPGFEPAGANAPFPIRFRAALAEWKTLFSLFTGGGQTRVMTPDGPGTIDGRGGVLLDNGKRVPSDPSTMEILAEGDPGFEPGSPKALPAEAGPGPVKRAVGLLREAGRLAADRRAGLGAALVLIGVALCVYAWPAYSERLYDELAKILMAAGAVSVVGGALLLRNRGRRPD